MDLETQMDILIKGETMKNYCKNCGKYVEHYFPTEKKGSGWRHFEGEHFFYHCKTSGVSYEDAIRLDVHARI